ncbi:MAG: hypothetical protein ABJQ85_00090 [Rhizobiaceae bacterium]
MKQVKYFFNFFKKVFHFEKNNVKLCSKGEISFSPWAVHYSEFQSGLSISA